jgi:transposase
VAVRQLRPVPPPETVVRFETPAGRQGQVDFAEFRFPWGKRSTQIVGALAESIASVYRRSQARIQEAA